MPFRGHVTVKQLNSVEFALVEELFYAGRNETFTVPAGFRTDFASVPRPFVWLLPRYGLYSRSAILHDYLWRYDIVSRRDADGLFRRSMRELGVSVPRRWIMWAAVRLVSTMSGASATEWLQFLLVAVLAIPFVAFPAVIVQLWLLAFWIIEGVFFLAGRVFETRSGRSRPVSPFRC
jgi:hypothetical protein